MTPLKPVMRLDPSMPVEVNGEPCLWGRAINWGARHRATAPAATDDPLMLGYSCHPDAWALLPPEKQAGFRLES